VQVLGRHYPEYLALSLFACGVGAIGVCSSKQDQEHFYTCLRDKCVAWLMERGCFSDGKQLTAFLDSRCNGYVRLLSGLEEFSSNGEAWMEALIRRTAYRFELQARGVNPDGDGSDDPYTKEDALLVGSLRMTSQSLWVNLFQGTRELTKALQNHP
jgi:hypothetical protein